MLTNLLQLFKIALTVRKTIVKFRISFTNKVKQRKKLPEIEKEFLVFYSSFLDRTNPRVTNSAQRKRNSKSLFMGGGDEIFMVCHDYRVEWF